MSRKNTFYHYLCLSLLITSLLTLNLYGQQKEGYASLKDALNTGYFLRGKHGPVSVNWINSGNEFSYIADQKIYTFNPETKSETLIFDKTGLTFPETSLKFDYESFQWSHDSKHLVFKANSKKIYRRSAISDFYIYDVQSKNLKQAAKSARSAELSPDGSMVGIERNGNMSVLNFKTGKELALTNDKTSDEGVFNGHFDWVYEEEFGLAQGWNWSPDSKYMAFWQFDEKSVPIFQMSDYVGLHPEQLKIPIPQPGDNNPAVRIGITNASTGKKIFLQPDETGDFYIPRIYWTSNPDELALMTLNRAQNHMKLYFFNVKTGQHRVVLEEQNANWVAIFNFYTDVNDMVYFPLNSKEFFWVSDRSGFNHLYRYDYSGKLLNQVTKGDWDLIKVVGIDPVKKVVSYLSAEASSLEQQLYAINFDGSNKARLSTEHGNHTINMSPNTRFYLDSYSNISQPLKVTLNEGSGKLIKVMEDNKPVQDFLLTHQYAGLNFFSFKTSDGQKIDGSMIKPVNFDSTKKYPVVFTVYGGPESHEVFDAFSSNGYDQWLAQNGYLVIDINNRGTANYGSKFLKVVYKQLGKWESNDFAEAARYIGSLPYADKTNMAIVGTSYGGYSTCYTLLTHPGIFKAGIANSPVTDWRLYDNIYTERYMAPLKDNEAGYEKSSAMTYAAQLKDHLFLIHSMSDDNVHPANTMQLLTALTNAGKDADLRIYPLGAHGAAYNQESHLLIQNLNFQYLERYLKGKTDNALLTVE